MSRVKQLQTQNIWKMLHVNLCRAVKRRRTAMEMFMRRVWHQQCAFCYVHAGRWANVQVCQFAFLFPQRDSFICFRTISLNAHNLHTMLSCLGDVICKERRFDSDSWDWNMEIEKFTLVFVMLFCRYPREHIHTYIHTYIVLGDTPRNRWMKPLFCEWQQLLDKDFSLSVIQDLSLWGQAVFFGRSLQLVERRRTLTAHAWKAVHRESVRAQFALFG